MFVYKNICSFFLLPLGKSCGSINIHKTILNTKENEMRYSRQNKILELISTNIIETQDKLAALLKESGFDVTQATVSRDIKELQLIKVQTSDGQYKYSQTANDDGPYSERYLKILKDTVLSYTVSENILLINTMPGCAKSTATAIDNIGLPHVLGTIAGDNAIFVLLDAAASASTVCKGLEGLLK